MSSATDDHLLRPPRGEERQDNHIVVATPDNPTSVQQDHVANEVRDGDEQVCSEVDIRLVREAVSANVLLWRRLMPWESMGLGESPVEVIELECEMRSAAQEEDAVRYQNRSVGSTLVVSWNEYSQSKEDQHGVYSCEKS